MNALLKSALEYHEQGLNPTPLRPNSKAPILSDWNQRPRLTPEQIAEFWDRKDPHNVGLVATPFREGFACVIDVDKSKFWKHVPDEFKAKRNRTWVVQTASHGSHIHIILPEISSLQGKRFFVNGEPCGEIPNQAVAPHSVALSKHTNTLEQYVFLSKPSEIESFTWDELSFLTDAQGVPIHPKEDAALEDEDPANRLNPGNRYSRPFGLPWSLYLPLRTGMQWIGGQRVRVRDRSAAELKLVTFCRSRGWSFEQVRDLFQNQAYAGARFRDSSKSHGVALLRHWWDEAGKTLAGRHEEFLRLHRDITAFVRSKAWPATETDRAVFEGLLRLAHVAGKFCITAPERTLADLAGVHRETVRTSFKRLLSKELLKREKSLETEFYLAYDLRSVIFRPYIQYPAPQSCMYGQEMSLPAVNHDLFRSHGFRAGTNTANQRRHSGLGKIGLAVFRHIAENPGRSTKEVLSDLSHVASSRTILRKLMDLAPKQPGKKSKQLGLICNHHGWRLVTTDANELQALIERAAIRLGTSGTGNAQKERHAREREKYRRRVQAFKKAQADAQKLAEKTAMSAGAPFSRFPRDLKIAATLCDDQGELLA